MVEVKEMAPIYQMSRSVEFTWVVVDFLFGQRMTEKQKNGEALVLAVDCR